uniref:LIM zinc-binding domain-containing protein n=1 Tax=Balaenoptera musculus TaxID=9771 RepID=A0A8C0E7F5_BALMU
VFPARRGPQSVRGALGLECGRLVLPLPSPAGQRPGLPPFFLPSAGSLGGRGAAGPRRDAPLRNPRPRRASRSSGPGAEIWCQDDRALRLPPLRGLPLRQEVRPAGGAALLRGLLRGPLRQHVRGVRNLIGCDCKDLSYKDRHWHEACFHCSRCRGSLVDKPFAAKEDQLLCTDCYSQEYSSRCQECKKSIMPGTRKMEYKGSSWHETCFICHRCQQPSEPRASSRRTARTSAFPATKGSMLCSAFSAKSPSPAGASRTGSSPGTASASCAPPARSRCRASASRPATSSPTAWAASATCTPRSAPAAPAPSADWVAPSTSPSRSGSGTTTALTARSARCRWWGEASSRRGTTSLCPDCGKDI